MGAEKLCWDGSPPTQPQPVPASDEPGWLPPPERERPTWPPFAVDPPPPPYQSSQEAVDRHGDRRPDDLPYTGTGPDDEQQAEDRFAHVHGAEEPGLDNEDGQGQLHQHAAEYNTPAEANQAIVGGTGVLPCRAPLALQFNSRVSWEKVSSYYYSSNCDLLWLFVAEVGCDWERERKVGFV